MKIKRQMIDFLCGDGMEIFELSLAEREIVQIEKVLDTEQSRHRQKQMQRSTNVRYIWRVGRSEVWLEHMTRGGNGRRCYWKSSWGQNVKDHQRSAKGLGVYPAGNGDPTEVFSRAVKWVDLFFRNYFSGIRVADELERWETGGKTYSNSLLTGLPATTLDTLLVEVPAGYPVQTALTKLNIGKSHLQPDKLQGNYCKTYLASQEDLLRDPRIPLNRKSFSAFRHPFTAH